MYKNIQCRAQFGQLGYREQYKAGETADGVRLSVMFGIDASGRPTKPAVFTPNGIQPLSAVAVSGFDNFMKSHRGLYSMSGVTLGMCVLQGKVSGGQWSKDTMFEIFVPNRKTQSGIEFIQLSEGNGAGVVHFDNLSQLKHNILCTITPYICNREMFYTARMQ